MAVEDISCQAGVRRSRADTAAPSLLPVYCSSSAGPAPSFSALPRTADGGRRAGENALGRAAGRRAARHLTSQRPRPLVSVAAAPSSRRPVQCTPNPLPPPARASSLRRVTMRATGSVAGSRGDGRVGRDGPQGAACSACCDRRGLPPPSSAQRSAPSKRRPRVYATTAHMSERPQQPAARDDEEASYASACGVLRQGTMGARCAGLGAGSCGRGQGMSDLALAAHDVLLHAPLASIVDTAGHVSVDVW